MEDSDLLLLEPVLLCCLGAHACSALKNLLSIEVNFIHWNNSFWCWMMFAADSTSVLDSSLFQFFFFYWLPCQYEIISFSSEIIYAAVDFTCQFETNLPIKSFLLLVSWSGLDSSSYQTTRCWRFCPRPKTHSVCSRTWRSVLRASPNWSLTPSWTFTPCSAVKERRWVRDWLCDRVDCQMRLTAWQGWLPDGTDCVTGLTARWDWLHDRVDCQRGLTAWQGWLPGGTDCMTGLTARGDWLHDRVDCQVGLTAWQGWLPGGTDCMTGLTDCQMGLTAGQDWLPDGTDCVTALTTRWDWLHDRIDC